MKNPDIPMKAKGLMLYFRAFAGAKGFSFPSVSQILFHCKINKETYRKYRQILEQNGELELLTRRDSGRFSGNVYRLANSVVTMKNEALDDWKNLSQLLNFFTLSPSPKNGVTENHLTENRRTVNKGVISINEKNKNAIYHESCIMNFATQDTTRNNSYQVSSLDVSIVIQRLAEYEKMYSLKECTLNEALNDEKADTLDYIICEFFKV
jgi:hypothetical protein